MAKGPQIIIENFEGKHNIPERYEAFKKMGAYRNMNTVCVIPTRGKMLTKVAMSWMNIAGGFNSAFPKVMIEACEVGAAYNYAITMILSNPGLAAYPYMLTLEEDNTPPPDGLHKLLESIQEYDAVSGLYWLKGPTGCPQIWGDQFVPQPPLINALQRCNGIGMGFALFRLDMFKNPGFTYGEWFKTAVTPEEGGPCTQDLYFWRKAKTLGFRCAVDTRVKVGHVDVESGDIW
jgi:hypothetical protein